MKKFVFAAVFTLAVVGWALAEEINVSILKIDTDKSTITYKKKGKKGADPGEAVTVTYTKTVKVAKGKMDMDTKKVVLDEEIKDGVKAEPFAKIDEEKGLNATITIADDGPDKGKVTQILLTKGGGGKGGKKGGN
jgi:hypothetical protein